MIFKMRPCSPSTAALGRSSIVCGRHRRQVLPKSFVSPIFVLSPESPTYGSYPAKKRRVVETDGCQRTHLEDLERLQDEIRRLL